MKISVAIATYNGERYIKAQLESILNQDMPVDEVIICDDRSTDNTLDVVEEFIKENGLANWKVYKNPKNLGFSRNFFNAISKTTGDIIFLADQDDVWLPNKVSVMCGIMSQNPGILALSSRYSLIDSSGRDIQNSGIINVEIKDDGAKVPVSVGSLIGCSYIRGCATCFRASLKSSLIDINLDDLLAHDWLINILASLKGENYIVNKILFKYRYHGDNASLTAVSRKRLIGDIEKRKRGLQQSIFAHSYILEYWNEYKNTTSSIKKKIERCIKFEKLRLKFLKTRSIPLYFALLINIRNYKMYYKSLLKGVKVLIGDFLYAYNIGGAKSKNEN